MTVINDSSTVDRLLIALCTYNERDTLPRLLECLWQSVPRADVLVVDDHSPDGTGQWAQSFAEHERRLTVIHRPSKLGLGTALKRAIQHAHDNRYEWLANLDADLSHDPRHLLEMIDAVRRSSRPLDVVVGSRYVPGGKTIGWPWKRRFLSRCLNLVARPLLRLPVRDASGSYRLYRVASLQQLPLDSLRASGYALLEELLWHLHRNGAAMAEIPIEFVERAAGRSKVTGREAIGVLGVLLRLGWKSLLAGKRIDR
jgi:dolichol-phosphate mannosyltransferase